MWFTENLDRSWQEGAFNLSAAYGGHSGIGSWAVHRERWRKSSPVYEWPKKSFKPGTHLKTEIRYSSRLQAINVSSDHYYGSNPNINHYYLSCLLGYFQSFNMTELWSKEISANSSVKIYIYNVSSKGWNQAFLIKSSNKRSQLHFVEKSNRFQLH